MDIQRIDSGTKYLLFNATAQDVLQRMNDGVVHGFDPLRSPDVFTFVDIFDADNPHKVHMLIVVIERERHQPPNGLNGLKLIEVQQVFSAANLAVELLQHLNIQLLFAGEVVIDHAF